ncbi:MAG: hypothetical protein OEX07_09255, partial [Gammaproteobacteria bacterium]|nr:hypothetical protein [Gammaproteobacteria bacterium]
MPFKLFYRQFKLRLTLVVFPLALTALTILTTQTACTDNKQNVLNFGLASMPSNLDPRFATDASS